MITLTYDTTTLTLPPDLVWVDEFAWQPVEQAVQRSLTGALIVEARARTGGRPITLQPADDNAAWAARSLANTLYAWASVPLRQMTLSLGGVNRTVIWRLHDEPAFDARSVAGFSDPGDDDFYLLTLKLMEL